MKFSCFMIMVVMIGMVVVPQRAGAIGFHGGGGFHGAGGFSRGGMGGIAGGGFRPGGSGMGGLRPNSGGGFRPGGGGFSPGGRFPSSFGGMNAASRGFGHAAAPNFGARGYRPGAGGNPFDRGLDSFGSGAGEFRPGGGRLAGGRLTPDAINSFLGMQGRSGGSALPGRMGQGNAMPWSAGHAGNRSQWQNASPQALSGIKNRIQGAVRPGTGNKAGMNNWLQNHPDRAQQWQNRADQIRNPSVRPANHPWAQQHPAASSAIAKRANAGTRPGNDWWSQQHPEVANQIRNRFDHTRPGSDWWSKYHPNLSPWYYHHGWGHHDWRYWWGHPTWGAFVPWFSGWGWTEPVYYDYGTGGNVVYEGNSVYVNGQDVGTPQEYSQSAAELATVPTSTAQSLSDDSSQDDDWLPLGTFAVTSSPDDSNPSRILQLAVDHQGVISGTMHNSTTGKSYVVQGRVDKQTQRVAMTIGDKSDVVLETGIYNLAQPQTPALVHYGQDRTETMLLVRLDAPQDDAASS